MAGVIILDANVLIGFLDATDPHHDASLDLLERHFVDGFGSNVLTVAEALVHPTRVGRQDAAAASLAKIGVQVIGLGTAEASSLAGVRTAQRVRMPAAVALHTAIQTGSALATFDASLAAAAERAGVPLAS